MNQVKQGSKTIILDLFQALSAKKCRPNKGLDSPMPRPSTNDPNYATSSSEIGELHYLCGDEIVGQLSRIKMTRQTKKKQRK